MKELRCWEYGPRRCIHNASFSSLLTNVHKKLECLSLASLPAQYYVTLQLIRYIGKLWRNWGVENTVPGLHSQHFNFFLTYKWVQQARALHFKRLERHPRDKHFNLQKELMCCENGPKSRLLSMRFCDDTSPVETQLYKTFFVVTVSKLRVFVTGKHFQPYLTFFRHKRHNYQLTSVNLVLTSANLQLTSVNH